MRYLFLYIILHGLAATNSSAQISLQHDKSLKSLSVDEKGTLVVTDDLDEDFQIINGELSVVKGLKPSDDALDSLEIWEGQLRKNLVDGYQLYDLPFVPKSFTQMDAGLLIATDSDLWLLENGQPRQFFVQGISFPKDVKKVFARNQLLGLLTEDNRFYLYNSDNQILKYVDNQVSDFAIDNWQVAWYSRGRQLTNFNDYAQNSVPIINVLAITDTKQEQLRSPIILSDTQNEIFIEFAVKYPPLIDQVKLFYKLNDSEWLAFESQKRLHIRSLKEGINEIMLRAVGMEDQVGLSELIRVKGKQTPLTRFWPWLLGGFMLLFGVNLLSQFRLKSEMKRLESEKEKYRLQAQVDTERQKLGQLQMNPHFIFNTLNSISGLIALNENKKARTNLNNFSRIMRQVLDHSQKEFIPINEELKFLTAYLDLEKMIRNNLFDYQIDNSLAENYFVPPMILQPFLENAIVHGLVPKKVGGQLGLTIKETEKSIVVSIEDNGIGRAEAALNKREGHESAAIKIIEQRLKNLNKWEKLELVYEDLKDIHGNAVGTRVLLHLPKRKS